MTQKNQKVKAVAPTAKNEFQFLNLPQLATLGQGKIFNGISINFLDACGPNAEVWRMFNTDLKTGIGDCRKENRNFEGEEIPIV